MWERKRTVCVWECCTGIDLVDDTEISGTSWRLRSDQKAVQGVWHSGSAHALHLFVCMRSGVRPAYRPAFCICFRNTLG